MIWNMYWIKANSHLQLVTRNYLKYSKGLFRRNSWVYLGMLTFSPQLNICRNILSWWRILHITLIEKILRSPKSQSYCLKFKSDLSTSGAFLSYFGIYFISLSRSYRLWYFHSTHTSFHSLSTSFLSLHTSFYFILWVIDFLVWLHLVQISRQSFHWVNCLCYLWSIFHSILFFPLFLFENFCQELANESANSPYHIF